jgi:hypothetical protein
LLHVTKERDALRRKASNLERDLESYALAVSHGQLNGPSEDGASNGKLSKAKRSVLSARVAAAAEHENVTTSNGSMSSGSYKKGDLVIPKPGKQKSTANGGCEDQQEEDSPAGAPNEEFDGPNDKENNFVSSTDPAGTAFFVSL